MSERDLDRLEYRRSLGLSHDASTCGGAERDLAREVAERLYHNNQTLTAAAEQGAREALLEAAKAEPDDPALMMSGPSARTWMAGWERGVEAMRKRLRALAGEQDDG